MSRPIKGAKTQRSMIDWKKMEDLCLFGCRTVEIANYFGIDKEYLDRITQQTHNVTLAHYRSMHRARGNAEIRRVTYQKAVEGKDTKLLMYLGKTRLKDRDPNTPVYNITQNIPKTPGVENLTTEELIAQLNALNQPKNETDKQSDD